MPTIKVYEENKLFILKDEAGMQYGIYTERKLAKERCVDWNNYYQAPLVDEKPKS